MAKALLGLFEAVVLWPARVLLGPRAALRACIRVSTRLGKLRGLAASRVGRS